MKHDAPPRSPRGSTRVWVQLAVVGFALAIGLLMYLRYAIVDSPDDGPSKAEEVAGHSESPTEDVGESEWPISSPGVPMAGTSRGGTTKVRPVASNQAPSPAPPERDWPELLEVREAVMAVDGKVFLGGRCQDSVCLYSVGEFIDPDREANYGGHEWSEALGANSVLTASFLPDGSQFVIGRAVQTAEALGDSVLAEELGIEADAQIASLLRQISTNNVQDARDAEALLMDLGFVVE